jgi:hypothetical protein
MFQVSQATLPNNAALRKIIRRKRKEINAVPADPANFQELDTPQSYQQYVPKADVTINFLLCDSGPGADTILIFGREDWLHHLFTTDTWYVDGTFKISPNIFSQVYVILAKKFSGVHSVDYALLPNKQGATTGECFL